MIPRRRRVPLFAPLTLVVALLATACGTGPPDHVRLGVVAPLTGPRAFIGREVVNGVEMAVDDLNADGGLLGRDVELVVRDDGDLVDLPGQLAELAERERVSAVIGPEAPGILLGPRSPLARRDVPAVLPASFGGDLDDASSPVLRTIPSARVQAERLGRWFSEVRAIPRVAVLLADVVEGNAVRDELEAGLRAGGVEVAGVVEADGSAGQLGPAVARLRRAAPDVGGVVLWGQPPAAARATVAVRRQDWHVQPAVPASAFVAEYRTLAGGASESVVLAFPFRTEWFRGERLTRWMLRYQTRHGLGALPDLRTLVLDVPVAAVAAYDAARLVGAAVSHAGSRRPAAVADALPEVRHRGILRTYRLGGREAWAADDLFVARFHRLATTFDVDPRLDVENQRWLWEAQVKAEFLPEDLADGPVGDLVRRVVAARDVDPPEYAPPLPPPGPVARVPAP